jgi:3-deoxy-D-arabino-heptulosonate 7-phosphate (DAHP) synthase
LCGWEKGLDMGISRLNSGIRTFETYTRNTLDITCSAIIKQQTSLPVIVDVSHSLGRADLIEPIYKFY